LPDHFLQSVELDFVAILIEMSESIYWNISIIHDLYDLPLILLNDSVESPKELKYDFILNADFDGKDVLLIRETLSKL
jgi:hypothetical protein